MKLSLLSDLIPDHWNCGYISWCRFCGDLIWSGDSSIIFAMDPKCDYYCHNDCLIKWNRAPDAPKKPDGTVDYWKWLDARPPAKFYLPYNEFIDYAERIIVRVKT